MSSQWRLRVAGLLTLLGFLLSGCLYFHQQFHGEIVFKDMFLNVKLIAGSSLSNNRSHIEVSSANLTSTTKHGEVTPLGNLSQRQDVHVSQFVSFDNSVYDGRRLGNQLFAFAAVAFVAELTGRRPVVKNTSKPLLLEQVFKLNLERVDTLCPCHTIGEARHLSYDKNTENEVLKVGHKSIVISGFRQSWKYTMAIEHRLRRYLVFQDDIRIFAEHFLQNNIPPGWKRAGFVRVGIHVRRGDITTNPQFINYGYTVPNATYFEKAMIFFIEKYVRVQFIAMSDDRNWTMENIVIPVNMSADVSVNVTHSFNHTAGQDLAILSLCDHVIMSTGTYGWWGAWLAKGTTIYYKDWPRVGSGLYGHFNDKDFFPPNWIPRTS